MQRRHFLAQKTVSGDIASSYKSELFKQPNRVRLNAEVLGLLIFRFNQPPFVILQKMLVLYLQSEGTGWYSYLDRKN